MLRRIVHCSMLRVPTGCGQWVHSSTAAGGEPEAAVIQMRERAIRYRKKRIESLSVDIFGRGNVFTKNVQSLEALPEGRYSLPEVAFIGTTNTGKSTLIANLAGNSRLGRKSQKAGNTKRLAFFNIGDAISLVDTPGYGAYDVRALDEGRQPDQQIAIGVLLQYLALRKNKNLKHVYWCIKGQPKDKELVLSARHEELLRFLLYERIPFTPVITRADVYAGRDHELQRDTDRLRSFLGNPRLPVLHTGCVWNAERSIVASFGTDALMYDLVSHVCKGVPNKDLTYDKVHSMSYLPYSVEEQLRVERAYPRERILMPLKSFQTMGALVAQHESARLGFAESVRFGHNASMAQIEAAIKDSMHNYKNNLTIGEREEQVMQLITGEVGMPSAAGGAADQLLVSPAYPNQVPPQRLAPAATPELLEDGGDASQSSSAVSALEGGNESQGDSVDDAVAFAAYSDALAPGDAGQLATVGTQLTPLTMDLTPFQAEIVASGVSPAFPCILLPQSMFAVHTDLHIATMDKRSLQAFERQQQGATLEASYAKKDTFLTAGRVGPGEEGHDELRAPRRISQAARRHDKYMVRTPHRTTALTSDKEMCPWLGAEKEGRVLGMEEGPVSSRGGTMVANLKERGFGGKSHSVFTHKSRHNRLKGAPIGRWSQ